MDYITIVVAILAGLAISIPLISTVVKVTRENVQQKNWAALMRQVIGLMQTAEEEISSGADRKKWVMDMTKEIAIQVNYPLTDEDLKKISEMVDAFIAATKKINTPKVEDGALITEEATI